MRSVSVNGNSVNPMSIDTARIKRDVAFHEAAQALANAVLVRRGDAPRPLSTMDPHEREWFKQTSRQLIEMFERLTLGKVPDAEVRATDAQHRQSLDRQLTALRNQIDIARQRTRIAATERGHDLGSWHAKSDRDGHEVAYCTRCRRSVEIEIGTDPEMAGPAISEGCITTAEPESRPDAFLANLDARRI